MDDRDLYAPRGVRKEWDRCAVDARDYRHVFRDFGGEKITRAFGWYDHTNALRVMSAITSDGKNLVFRRNTKGYSITVKPRAPAAAAH